MPRLDGSGPLGEGPMTGWGRGNCRGTSGSAPMDQPRRPMGMGRGGRGFAAGGGSRFRGLGRCWRRLFSSRLPETRSDELTALRDELARTKEELAKLQARLDAQAEKP
ncbi:MAG: DUF5320 domain-containing protein [Thermodesulfobacteriota bacterium]